MHFLALPPPLPLPFLLVLPPLALDGTGGGAGVLVGEGGGGGGGIVKRTAVEAIAHRNLAIARLPALMVRAPLAPAVRWLANILYISSRIPEIKRRLCNIIKSCHQQVPILETFMH